MIVILFIRNKYSKHDRDISLKCLLPRVEHMKGSDLKTFLKF